jgi:hypothetical protein
MSVTIGKIIINAVKLFFYMVKPALYKSNALKIFKLLNLNHRQNAAIKLALKLFYLNNYSLILDCYTCRLKININRIRLIKG